MSLRNKIIHGDIIDLEISNEDLNTVSLAYIDPPFNLGKPQKRVRQKNGEKLEEYNNIGYNDTFDDFENFIINRVKKALNLLSSNGSLFVHLNCKEVHYIKVALDKILGRSSFINEIIYSWDYGARSKKKWSQKHDTILWYAINPDDYIFNYDQIDRIPYKAPGLVRRTSPENSEEKIAAGKTPTDCWDLGIVHTMSKEATKYPTQKPLKLLERIVKVHSNPGDLILDFFCGSGSFGDAAKRNGRDYLLIDNNVQAIEITKARLCADNPED